MSRAPRGRFVPHGRIALPLAALFLAGCGPRNSAGPVSEPEPSASSPSVAATSAPSAVSGAAQPSSPPPSPSTSPTQLDSDVEEPELDPDAEKPEETRSSVVVPGGDEHRFANGLVVRLRSLERLPLSAGGIDNSKEETPLALFKATLRVSNTGDSAIALNARHPLNLRGSDGGGGSYSAPEEKVASMLAPIPPNLAPGESADIVRGFAIADDSLAEIGLRVKLSADLPHNFQDVDAMLTATDARSLASRPAAAAASPQVLTGSGSAAGLQLVKPGGPGAALLAVTWSKDMFILGFDAKGEETWQARSMDGGPQASVEALDFDAGAETVSLEVSAEGPWRIEVRPLSAARPFTDAASGTGNEVLQYAEKSGSVLIPVEGDSQMDVHPMIGGRLAHPFRQAQALYDGVGVPENALIVVNATTAWRLEVFRD